MQEVNVITSHKPLVAMISKDVAMLSWQLQHIMLYMLQYCVCILFKLGPELYIAYWLLCHSHIENKDQEITGMNVSIHTINTKVDVPI